MLDEPVPPATLRVGTQPDATRHHLARHHRGADGSRTSRRGLLLYPREQRLVRGVHGRPAESTPRRDRPRRPPYGQWSPPGTGSPLARAAASPIAGPRPSTTRTWRG